MGRILKIVLGAVAAFVLLLIVAVLIVALTFDPNDYKDEIIAKVESTTGRDFAIDGDIGLKLFPVLAVDLGAMRLGNAEGFDENEDFASLDGATVSIRVLPALLRREIQMGSVTVDSLKLNLAVDARGRTNWDDLTEAPAEVQAPEEQVEDGLPIQSLEVAGLEISDAAVVYTDAGAGTRYVLEALELRSGRVAAGRPLDLRGGFRFQAEPNAISGDTSIELTVSFTEGALAVSGLAIDASLEGLADVPVTLELAAEAIGIDLERQTATPGLVELKLLDVDIDADFKPVDYSESLTPQARISVAPFSVRRLMATLGLDALPTADPDVLERVSVEALVYSNDKESGLNDLVITIDDTTLRGRIAKPTDRTQYRIALAGDSIDLTRYMAPPDEGGGGDDAAEAPVEIPVDLIRAFDVDATFKLEEARLGEMRFTGLELGALSTAGNLRLHPIRANFFDGSYSGDIRIDASGAETLLSVNETIADVALGPLVEALYQRRNVTGTIDGNFQLAGRGADIDAIRRDLDGTMRIRLADGVYEGTDIWHQLRVARARLKGEAAPEPSLPPRTRFSDVSASGTVTDGVLRNDDLVAELPYLRLSGSGTVNFVDATLDYSLRARVLERPEFATGATEAELAEFTEAVIPLTIKGPLASPTVRPDVEGLVRQRLRDEAKKLEEEAKKRVLDKLLGSEEEPPAEGEEQQDTEGEPKPEDVLKDKLKDLFKR